MYPIEFKELIEDADRIYHQIYPNVIKNSEIPWEDRTDPTKFYIPPSSCFKRKLGYIYFLRDKFTHPELIKVGYTTNWKRRLCGHRTYLPSPKIVAIAPGDLSDEHQLHDWLTKVCNRHVFKEWFSIVPSEIQEFLNHGFCEFEPINYPLIYF